jgi:hypothetical protein
MIIFTDFYKFRAHVITITAATMDINGTSINENNARSISLKKSL